jgi:hypothetical protein
MSSVRLNDKDYTVVLLAGLDGEVASGLAAAGEKTFNRPANTTPYVAARAIGSATTAIHEINLGVAPGSLVQLDTVTLTMARGTLPSGMTTVDCHLFTAAPTAIADNGAFNLSTGDRTAYAGLITLDPVALIGGSFCYSRSKYQGLQVKLLTSSVFVVPITAGAYTPISATEHILRVRGYNLGVAA